MIEKRIKSNTKIEPRINNRRVNKEKTHTHIAKQTKPNNVENNEKKKRQKQKHTHTQL